MSHGLDAEPDRCHSRHWAAGGGVMHQLTPQERDFQASMIYGSVELARRIAIGGKVHGPCCEKSLIAYVETRGEDPTLTPRQLAIKQRQTKYHGSACTDCGNTLRDTSTSHCTHCRIIKRRKVSGYAERVKKWGENRHTARALGELTYEGRPCSNCEATTRYVKSKSCIACSATARIKHRQVLAENARAELEKVGEAFGVTVEQALTASRAPDVIRARHAMWAQLRHRGYSFPRIASIFSVDHTSVLDAVRRFMARSA